jgi:hypothetical protein
MVVVPAVLLLSSARRAPGEPIARSASVVPGIEPATSAPVTANSASAS